MGKLNWARAEMEDILRATGEPLAMAGKNFIARYASVGGITAQQAAELGVDPNKNYCPVCSAEADSETGCAIHGPWW